VNDTAAYTYLPNDYIEKPIELQLNSLTCKYPNLQVEATAIPINNQSTTKQ
jgi:hypothetical protein